MTAPPRPTGFGMRRRLLLAQALVLLAGGVTTWVVALVVGPPLFREPTISSTPNRPTSTPPHCR
jgi:hypothetical protein